MSAGYSLRRQLLLCMAVVFALGLGASVLFEYLESIDIKAPGGAEGAIEVLLVALPLLVVSLLIWLITGWSLAPIARASRQAEQIGPSDAAARISDKDLPREIQPLVAAVNGALDRLAGAYEAERHLTADAAHELRTPLAVLSTRLQRAKLDERRLDWPAIEADIARLDRLVGQIVDLARKEAAGRTDRSEEHVPVNLARVAREVAAMMLPLAEKAGRSLEVDAPEAVTLRGRPHDLGDMVRNLVDNALAHGRGTIRVRVALEGRQAIVEVADEGPGTPEALRAGLFGRFRKGSTTSPGAGLGLAIVRHVARSHGGDATFAPGPRCVVRVTLPGGQKGHSATAHSVL
jgi:two-component system, OmpR family, sensor histidine kinase TctE